MKRKRELGDIRCIRCKEIAGPFDERRQIAAIRFLDGGKAVISFGTRIGKDFLRPGAMGCPCILAHILLSIRAQQPLPLRNGCIGTAR